MQANQILAQNPWLLVLQLAFVFGFVCWRQLRPRPVRLLGTLITSALLVAGFVVISLGPHLGDGTAWPALAAALPDDLIGILVGGALGYRFGSSMQLRIDPQKGFVRQASWRLVVFWMALVSFRYVVRYLNASLLLPMAEPLSDGLLALALASVISRNVTTLIRAQRLAPVSPETAAAPAPIAVVDP